MYGFKGHCSFIVKSVCVHWGNQVNRLMRSSEFAQEESVNRLLGHQFVQRRMQKPSSCSACEEIIWQDGIACQSECVSGSMCTHPVTNH